MADKSYITKALERDVSKEGSKRNIEGVLKRAKQSRKNGVGKGLNGSREKRERGGKGPRNKERG